MSLYPSSYTVEHFHNDDGTLLSGGTLEFYIAGTSTPTPFYIDSAATLGGTSVTLNDRGEPEVSGNQAIIWLSSDVNYKVVAKNASGGTEWTQDNLAAANAGGSAAEIAAADFSQWPSITLNGSDTAHDIDFTAGRIADTTGAELLVLASAMTKQIDAAWTSGNNQGGLFSGTVATSTTYYCFLIEANADQSIDCGFDTSSTAANIPTGYTKYRRIASFETDGSANIDSTSIIPLLSAEIAKRGENNGTASLDSTGRLPEAQLPTTAALDSDISSLQSQITSNDTDISNLESDKLNIPTTANGTLVWTGSGYSVSSGSITGGVPSGTYIIELLWLAATRYVVFHIVDSSYLCQEIFAADALGSQSVSAITWDTSSFLSAEYNQNTSGALSTDSSKWEFKKIWRL